MALALVIVVALSACADDDGDASATTTTSDGTAAVDHTSPSTAPPTYTGDSGSPFCDVLRKADLTPIPQGDPGDPAAVEASLRRVAGMLHDALALAPAEIEADLALVTKGMDALDASLAAVGYDFRALAAAGGSEDLTAAANDPAFATAGARLSAYRTQVCQL